MRHNTQPTGCPICHPASPETRAPLCPTCLTNTQQTISSLLYDWLDLEQLHTPTLTQNLTGMPGGNSDQPTPINAAAEALQAEILHVTTTWELEVRAARNLSNPPTHRVRAGAAIQRATTLLTNHATTLAALPPTTVYPTGCEDTPTNLTGYDAINHLTALHQRARAMLGHTIRTMWIPGHCPHCHTQPAHGVDGPLYRHEPRHPGDDPPVWCTNCGNSRTWDDYQQYMHTLIWPGTNPTQHEAAA